MFLQQEPTADTRSNQNARCDCEERALVPEFVDSSELRKVAIARAARTEVIEPLSRFVEGHRSRRDSRQDFRTWAPAALGIRKILEQTTAKCVQESPFVSRGISFCVQTAVLSLSHNIK